MTVGIMSFAVIHLMCISPTHLGLLSFSVLNNFATILVSVSSPSFGSLPKISTSTLVRITQLKINVKWVINLNLNYIIYYGEFQRL